MSTYVRKTGPDAAMKPEDEIKSLKLRLAVLEGRMELQGRLLEAQGFVWAGKNSQGFYHPKLRKCRCGRPPQLQEAIGEERQWLVICPECVLRTEQHAGVKEAMQAWNAGELTEESRMMEKRIRETGIDDLGAVELAHETIKLAVDDWKTAKKMRNAGEMAAIEKFFQESPMMMGADEEAIRDALRREG